MVLDKKTDPRFAKLIKQFETNEILFHEGNEGNTLILVINGSVALVHGKEPEYIVDTVGGGAVLGERAALKQGTFRHTITAKALTHTTVLQFSLKDLKLVEAKFPNLNTRLISTLCNRLDKANEIIKILQSESPASRLIQFLATLPPQETSKSVLTTRDEIQKKIQLNEKALDRGLEFLIDKKVISKNNEGYFLSDKMALGQILPTLQAHMEENL